jgi:hypothetical protein
MAICTPCLTEIIILERGPSTARKSKSMAANNKTAFSAT